MRRLAPAQARRLSALLFLIAGLCLLAWGGLRQRQTFLERGLPPSLPEPVTHGGVTLGLNVDLLPLDDDALARHLAAIKALEITYLKQAFYFRQPFDWTAADRLVTALAAHELELVPLLDGDPANQFSPPADPAAFATWAGSFARRYGPEVTHYIIWDEPNLASHWGLNPPNPAAYAALLSAAAAAIRAVDSEAVIIAAPLAPTVETGPDNLADPLFLQRLYEAGAAPAFDVAAGKPYGFATGPDDRRVELTRLNFSRLILLREVMTRNGDDHKALWAGNWGWNSLPAGWTGPPSIWGQVDSATRNQWTLEALSRARREWPWAGVLFLEHWSPAVAASGPAADPRWGFRVAGTPLAEALRDWAPPAGLAYPGFYPARPDDPAQAYQGAWRFSPAFGADIGQSGDTVRLRFYGTAVGLAVRRANFRARFHVTVDGQPANALPRDERGAALVLSAPAPDEDYVALELVAEGLSPGEHTLNLRAERGWDQWALQGFSVALWPPDPIGARARQSLILGAALALLGGLVVGRRAAWFDWWQSATGQVARLRQGWQLALAAMSAAVVGLTGWLTWGQQASGLYRRLGDLTQLSLTAGLASLFYVAPGFFIYAPALLLLLAVVYARPLWGLVLIAFSLPFYVLPKPMLGYRFSPVEVFTMVTAGAVMLHWATRWRANQDARDQPDAHHDEPDGPSAALGPETPVMPRWRWPGLDGAAVALALVATFSLAFTVRIDVASNEWRAVILEPLLFYLSLRLVGAWTPATRRQVDLWRVLDALVLGALVMALIGLGQYATGRNVIMAEGGLLRLRSVYGSPNNVALYLDRLIPVLLATMLMARGRRRWLYGLALLPIGLAQLLTFSRGGLFLGVPAGLLTVFGLWLAGSRPQQRARPRWPWLLGAAVVVAAAAGLILAAPGLGDRLNLAGATGILRLNLWRASLAMFRDHPLIGVGLDNFLYAYRGRYILMAAWQEPDLSHPHNVILDFATRLGLLGLLAGAWLYAALGRRLWRHVRDATGANRVAAVAFSGALVAGLAHGLVDHSFFLVDLAYLTWLMAGLAFWLEKNPSVARRRWPTGRAPGRA